MIHRAIWYRRWVFCHARLDLGFRFMFCLQDLELYTLYPSNPNWFWGILQASGEVQAVGCSCNLARVSKWVKKVGFRVEPCLQPLNGFMEVSLKNKRGICNCQVS